MFECCGCQVAAGPNSTHSAPSLAQLTEVTGRFTLHYPAIAVEGPAGFLDVYTKAPGSASPWQLTVPGGFNSTHSPPSLAQINGSTQIAAEGPSNSLNYYDQPTLSSPWTPLRLAPSGTTFG